MVRILLVPCKDINQTINRQLQVQVLAVPMVTGKVVSLQLDILLRAIPKCQVVLVATVMIRILLAAGVLSQALMGSPGTLPMEATTLEVTRSSWKLSRCSLQPNDQGTYLRCTTNTSSSFSSSTMKFIRDWRNNRLMSHCLNFLS